MTTAGKIEKQIIERLRQGGRVLMASHVNPDGDSIGSQLALYDLCRALGAQPLIVNHDPVGKRYRFLAKYDLLQVYDSETDYGDFDLAIPLEATTLERIGDPCRLLRDSGDIINIDHHPGNTGYGRFNYVDESVAAAGVLVYRLFTAANVSLSLDNAMELLMAIMTDTGRFCFSNTNAESMRIAAALIEKGANPKTINNALYQNFSEDQVRLMGELTAGMELHHQGNTCLLVCDRSLCDKYADDAADMEGLVNYSLYTAGVRVGVLLRELSDRMIKVSLRSRDTFDVAALARIYGGGGHRNAAGCYLEEPLAKAKMTLLKQIERGLPV
ncbi:MAG: bifunctional oligoribonuclease/PAP phosphatase NrnA [candidate division Zixibacteria bacterium]|nr:bifunctional oligoribonuclease/PAP phosphatase NrnA [candidate division Zixibacteria bacterium]